jgi:hypothetical protein
MKIRKNLARKHLDATNATKQDTSRLIVHFFKTRKELSSQTGNESNMK